MKNMTDPPPRLTWKGKLLRLLHITSNKTTTVDRHDPLTPPLKHHDDPLTPPLPFVVKSSPKFDFVKSLPETDFDDPPSDHLAHLPRDIILDILSRLPAECIFNCQCVSRPLQVLTTTPFFTHMQRQRSPPVIVVQLSSEITKLYYMNKEFERIEEKFTGSSSVCSAPVTTSPNFLLSSYEGFLMFSDFIDLPENFYMWNPITGEQITMVEKHMHVCGLYFNPLRKDHELLYYTIDKHEPFGQYCSFGAYGLRTKLKRDVGRFSYPPSRDRPPVIVEGNLYWMIDRLPYFWLTKNKGVRPPFSHSIMSFNIETEEFSTLEPGGRKYSTTEPRGYFDDGMLKIGGLHLSELDGKLCLCDFGTYNQLLLSTFNHATQCWSSRTIVILPKYRGHLIYDWPNRFASEVVQIKDNELLVRQGRRLLLYDMISHTWKISEIMGCMDKGIRVTVHTDRTDSFYL